VIVVRYPVFRSTNPMRKTKADVPHLKPQAGHVKIEDDGDTAHIWLATQWHASITLHRSDMAQEAFLALVTRLVSQARQGEL